MLSAPCTPTPSSAGWGPCLQVRAEPSLPAPARTLLLLGVGASPCGSPPYTLGDTPTGARHFLSQALRVRSAAVQAPVPVFVQISA